MTRADTAAARLDRLLNASPEYRHQLLDDWLQVATGAEVRRAWPQVGRMVRAAMPQWAVRHA